MNHDEDGFLDARTTRARLLQLAGMGAAGAALTSLAPSAEAAGTGTVHFLGWQGYDDKKAVAPAVKKGIKLSVEYITNNDEIVTKLRSGGTGSIDVVTPYFGYIKPLADAALIVPLDYSKLPSTKTYFREFARPSWNTFGGKVYSAPLVWADTPIVYRPDLIKPPASWLQLSDSRFKGKLTTLDDPLGNILIFAKAVLKTKTPNRITKDQLKRVMSFLDTVKPNIVTVSPSFGDVADILTRGDAALCIAGWRFLEVQLHGKGKPAKSFVPREGTFAWCDNYCIAKNAPNPDAAYTFIDTMISSQGDAIVATDTGSAVTNSSAVRKLPPKQRSLYSYNAIGTALKRGGLYGLPPLKPTGNLATFQDWQVAWTKWKS